MILEIINDNEILHRKCKPVEFPLSDDIKQLVEDMKETLVEKLESGLGLAAPQVNQDIQLLIMRSNLNSSYTDVKEKPIMVMFNPEIKKIVNDSMLIYREGCLSVPDKTAIVKRYKAIKIKYIDENGAPHQLRLDRTDSVVFQHEYDHLLGKLMTDEDRALQILDNPSVKEDNKEQESVTEISE